MDFRTRKNKGFTLAEMLVVVAIIGVLVGIVSVSISNSLEKAREATDLANIRSAMSEINNAYLNGETVTYYGDIKKNNGITEDPGGLLEKEYGLTHVLRDSKSTTFKKFVKISQKKPGWQGGISEVAGYSVPGMTKTYYLYKIEFSTTTYKFNITETAYK